MLQLSPYWGLLRRAWFNKNRKCMKSLVPQLIQYFRLRTVGIANPTKVSPRCKRGLVGVLSPLAYSMLQTKDSWGLVNIEEL